MRQGETCGHEFFVVASGNVVVQRDDQRLARLGPGEFFGEISLIDGRPRTATAMADGDTFLLALDHGQFDAMIEEFPGLGRQIARALVDRIPSAPVTVPQFGIFAQGTNAHAFVEWDLRPGVDLLQAASVLGRLRGPSVAAAGGVNLVLAFGSELWRVSRSSGRACGPRTVPADRPGSRVATTHPPPNTTCGCGFNRRLGAGRRLRAHTSGGRGDRHRRLGLANEQVAFVHRDSRDLTGFIDGTANPSLLDAPLAALVPDRDSRALAEAMCWPCAGYTTSMPSRRCQRKSREGSFGRTKADGLELADVAKPPTAHIARVEIEDAAGEVELPIYRRSVPYGTVAEHGLYFVAFSADRSRFSDTMLGRMFGTGDDGLRDRLTDFSRPVSGAYYYAPPLNVLADLPMSAADDQRVAVPVRG